MKRIIAVFFTVMLILSAAVILASASSMHISIENEEAFAGETAELDVIIENNTGISALYLDIRFDNRLELVKAADTGRLGGAYFSGSEESIPYVLSWDNTLKGSDNSSSGTIAKLTFRLPGNMPVGTYKISVSCDENEAYDSKLNNVPFTLSDGSITVKPNKVFNDSPEIFRRDGYLFFVSGTRAEDVLNKALKGTKIIGKNGTLSATQLLFSGCTVVFPDKSEYICILPGDIDSDGKITASDARIVLRFSVGLESPSEWQKTASDVDSSGKISASDARYVLRTSVGLENPELKLTQSKVETIDFDSDLGFVDRNIVSDEDDYDAAGHYITSQLKTFAAYVNLKKYSLSTADASLLVKEFINIVPELFYVVNSVNMMSKDGIIESFEFKFIDNAQEKVKEYNTMISDIASLADKSWSAQKKVLFFHDYVCSNYRYDESEKIHDAYSLLKQGKGVCQAYTLLLKALFEYHGIESRYVTSERMKHGWNIVKIDNHWYHVDATWDDPMNDRYGLTDHKNLLLSDDAIEDTGHKDWYCFGGNVFCDDTSYDDYFWQDVTSPFVALDGRWYFAHKYESGYAVFEWLSDEKIVVEKTFSARWQGILGLKLSGCYSGLAVYGNELIYNTADSVISYNPKNGNEQILYKENTSKQIFGIALKDRIYVTQSSVPEPKNPDIIPVSISYTGDCDGNKCLNGKDYSVLINYFSGKNMGCVTKNADFNKDNKINVRDAQALRDFLVNN